MNQTAATYLITANRELCEALLKKLHALPIRRRFVACTDSASAMAHSEKEADSTFVIDVAFPQLMCLLQQPGFLDKVINYRSLFFFKHKPGQQQLKGYALPDVSFMVAESGDEIWVYALQALLAGEKYIDPMLL